MRRRLKTPLLAALLGGAVLSVAWALRQNLAAAERQAEVRTLQTTRAHFETRLVQLEEPPVVVLDSAPTGPTVIPVGRTGAPAGGARPARAAGNEPADPWGLVISDPVLQNLYLTAERASLAGRYAAVWAELRLSPVEARKLEELILRRNEQRMDLDDIVRSNRLDDQDQTIARLWDRADQAFRSEMIGAFGKPALETFERYERALPVWELVNRFAGAVALEGQPLTAAQAVQLTETVAQASPPYQAGGRADTNAIDWPSVVTESAVILTEPQHRAFLNMSPIYPVPTVRREAPVLPATD